MQEVAYVDRLLERFAAEIEAFHNGGPDLGKKHLEEAERAGLDPEQIANLADTWNSARAKREARVQSPPLQPAQAPPPIKRRRVGVDPSAGPKPQQTEGAPKIEAPLSVSEKPFAQQLGTAIAQRPPSEVAAQPKTEAKEVVPARKFASQIAIPDLSQPAQIPEVIRLINLKHQIVGNYGGRCMVISWEPWGVNPRFLIPTFQKVGDFKNRYANRFVEQDTKTGTTRVAVGSFWLSHPASATFDGVSFRPGEDAVLPGRLLNLWRGFAVEPRKGSWRLIRRHIYLVLGNGDWKAGRYILKWFAHMFQNLGKPGQTILVFQGEEGVGKGIMAEALMLILGPYSLPLSDPKQFLGAFSGHLQHCVFLFLDEAFWAGDQKAEGRLKSLVTEKNITIEPKYLTPFQTPNLLHMMMASNSDWVVPAGRTARRYAVFKVSNKRRRDKAYFTALRDEIYSSGAAAMLYDLLRLELNGWEPQEIYETSALVEQKQRSLHGLDVWIEGILQKGRLPAPYSIKYPNRCLTQHLIEDALKYDRYTNETLVPTKLKEVFPDIKDFNNQSARGWAFPALADCRRLWEARYGGTWNWLYDVKEWQLP
jgi:hypothetical protein